MKYLIAGLGNVGDKYDKTRHNIGFDVLDALAGASNTSFSPDRHADVCTIKHKGRTLILIKPTTFMNLSGKAVSYWMQKEKIPLDRLLVITDDIALPTGKLRLRGKGSDGGHNGLKHIQETLGTNNWARLRFGVGSDFPKGHQIEYVLGEWDADQKEIVEEKIKLAEEMVLAFATIGLQRTMSEFNNK